MAHGIRILPLTGIPLVSEGDDPAGLIIEALARDGIDLEAGDVLVVAQKIISKAEGRLVRLDSVEPGDEARALAERTAKDPRLVELILRESRQVIRVRPSPAPGIPGVIIVEHRCGWVHANAGIDQSNVAPGEPGAHALLLPDDADASAATLRRTICERTGQAPGVVINDSAGRAWRVGTCGIALGSAGVAAVQDLRGAPDLFGRALEVSVVGHADELAAAAGLVQGQADERTPVVLIRGLAPAETAATAADLIRSASEDLFR